MYSNVKASSLNFLERTKSMAAQTITLQLANTVEYKQSL